jgi:hypothetical protein
MSSHCPQDGQTFGTLKIPQLKWDDHLIAGSVAYAQAIAHNLQSVCPIAMLKAAFENASRITELCKLVSQKQSMLSESRFGAVRP